MVSELDPSSRNMVVEQLRCVGRKDRSPAVVSSGGGLLSCVTHWLVNGRYLGLYGGRLLHLKC